MKKLLLGVALMSLALGAQPILAQDMERGGMKSKPNFQNMSKEEKRAFFESLPPEQQEKIMAKIKERMSSMSDEEKKAAMAGKMGGGMAGGGMGGGMRGNFGGGGMRGER